MKEDSTTAAEKKELFVFVATEKRGNATIASYYPIDGAPLVYRDGIAYFSISDDCAAHIRSQSSRIKELEKENVAIRHVLGEPTLNAKTLGENVRLKRKNEDLESKLKIARGALEEIVSEDPDCYGFIEKLQDIAKPALQAISPSLHE